MQLLDPHEAPASAADDDAGNSARCRERDANGRGCCGRFKGWSELSLAGVGGCFRAGDACPELAPPVSFAACRRCAAAA